MPRNVKPFDAFNGRFWVLILMTEFCANFPHDATCVPKRIHYMQCPLYSSVHSAQYPKWAIKCWRKESKLCTKSPDRIINWMGHCIRRKSTAEWAKDTNYYYTSTGESLGIATPPREMEWWVGGGVKRRRSSRRCRIRSTSKEVIQFHFGQLPSYAPKGKIINYGPICAFCRA